MSADAREELSLRGRPLHDLERHGQVVWLSYLRRNLLVDRHFRRLIEEYAVSGINFDAELLASAVSGGLEYREQIARLRESGRSPEEILEEVLLEDVCLASSALRDARPAELGGWIAVGVPPRHRSSVEAISGWATKLEEATGSDRILVKLPASTVGLRAVEGVVAAGHSVYVDQIFGLEQLERALEAHTRGLGLRLASGGDFESIRFVAAMHLLRIDVAADEMLRDRKRAGEGEADMVESLHGRAAIALGKLAWQRLRRWDGESPQAELAAKGARPAWLAWEGTQTLSPARRDVEYLEQLIGPRTISVVSRLALGAFRDHGETAATVGLQEQEAQEIVDDLRAVGVDPDTLAEDLQEAAIAAREARGARMIRAVTDGAPEPAMQVRAAAPEQRVGELEREADERGLVRRLWERDPTLWPAGVADPAHVRDRLGWLGLPESMSEEALPVLASRSTGDSSVSVVLLGMGGSSLGAEACRIAFGCRRFVILDTTVPAGIASTAARTDTSGAVFLVASKSGSTVETLALADFFWEREAGEEGADHWVAITDPGTPLHELARRRGFQRIWLNPPDVGGRYSVLSYFGLVPMALMGVDIGRVLGAASRMAVLSGAEVSAADNPAVQLGLLLAAGMQGGRDKLTLLASPRLTGLADWIEQLVAESTGKGGRGIVPVSQEPPGAVETYGDDRIFVQLRLEDEEPDEAEEGLLTELRERGDPVARFRLRDPHDIGAEFFRWQLAVSVCGALCGFDPFDEPDVAGAKARTRRLLDRVAEGGALGDDEPLARSDALLVYGDAERIGVDADEEIEPEELLRAVLEEVGAPDYVGVQAFLSPDNDTWLALQGLRALIRDRTGASTTVGWGPRFLHSTGQLHKGGSDRATFLQLTASVAGDLAIPGRGYSFGTLAAAQALADYRMLVEAGRRIVRVHFQGATEAGLASLLDVVRRSLS